jgi:hypothetical protein
LINNLMSFNRCRDQERLYQGMSLKLIQVPAEEPLKGKSLRRGLRYKCWANKKRISLQLKLS